MTALEHLEASLCFVGDRALAATGALRALTALHLSGSPRPTDAGLAALPSQLRSLEFSSSWRVSDAGLRSVAALTQLTRLRISSCPAVTCEGVAHLTALQRLRSLGSCNCDQVGDAALSQDVAALRASLTQLDVSCSRRITAAGLAHLCGLRQLRWLDVSTCGGVRDAGCSHLARLTALTHLDLCGCPVTERAAAALSALRRLWVRDQSGGSRVGGERFV